MPVTSSGATGLRPEQTGVQILSPSPFDSAQSAGASYATQPVVLSSLRNLSCEGVWEMVAPFRSRRKGCRTSWPSVHTTASQQRLSTSLLRMLGVKCPPQEGEGALSTDANNGTSSLPVDTSRHGQGASTRQVPQAATSCTGRWHPANRRGRGWCQVWRSLETCPQGCLGFGGAQRSSHCLGAYVRLLSSASTGYQVHRGVQNMDPSPGTILLSR